MQIGFPIETLGPECTGCGHRHHADQPHVRVLTGDEVDALLALARAGHLPDKGTDRNY